MTYWVCLGVGVEGEGVHLLPKAICSANFFLRHHMQETMAAPREQRRGGTMAAHHSTMGIFWILQARAPLSEGQVPLQAAGTFSTLPARAQSRNMTR